jgi:hypothetical protein
MGMPHLKTGNTKLPVILPVKNGFNRRYTYIPMENCVLLSPGTKPVDFRETVKECGKYACTWNQPTFCVTLVAFSFH